LPNCEYLVEGRDEQPACCPAPLRAMLRGEPVAAVQRVLREQPAQIQPLLLDKKA
jgi:hypothetical protein